MAASLLETLADDDIPPPPDELDRRVHERVNQALLVTHLLDFALCGVPWLVGQLALAIGHLCAATITGRFETRPKPPPSAAP